MMDSNLQRQESEMTQSQMSQINPLEDPLSDSALSVSNSAEKQGISSLGLIASGASQEDSEMT